jgi:endoglucanase
MHRRAKAALLHAARRLRTNAKQILENFVKVAREVSNDLPIWITEAGYDVHESSPLKAIPIGNKSALQTQADWILRTSLFAARNGVKNYFLPDV